MKTTLTLTQDAFEISPVILRESSQATNNNQPSTPEKFISGWINKLRIFYFACIILKKPGRIWKMYRAVLTLHYNVWGGVLKKVYKVGNKYYFNQYTPGWPSRAYDELIKSELRRHASPFAATGNLSFVFLAITRKCPLRCEHCFEWDNLNQTEVFTKATLFKTIDIFKRQGVYQFHFSGGEPMVRFKDLVELIKYAGKKCECWVLTSGFNFTRDNAEKLKNAGCKGVAVSIDHHVPELHNLFRGSNDSFEIAITAVREAKRAGMVVTISVCATRKFIEDGHMLPYMHFANSLGVHFVQVLEPKNVGQYKNRDVLLSSKHFKELDDVFEMVNHSKDYKNYPTMQYHGYHQRRIGCLTDSRSVYVDSAGDVHACPFCHTKSYNIIDIINNEEANIPVGLNACPRYEKSA